MSVPDDEGGVVDSIVGHPVGAVDRMRFGGSRRPTPTTGDPVTGRRESPDPVGGTARPNHPVTPAINTALRVVNDATSTVTGTVHSATGTFASATGTVASATGTLAETVAGAARYTARTFLSPAGLRGLAVEAAWCTAHAASYPWGLLREHVRTDGTYAHYRTDSLSPTQRSLLVTDMTAAGTPILLVHGIMDNRSVFTVFRRALRRRGFGVVHAVNYSVLTGDIRLAAHDLRRHVDRLRERTGSDRVHVVGHSLGGLIARYYVQRLGGDEAVHTLVTLGSPHGGSLAAYLMPTPLTRQVMPGSELLAELAEPAPRCRTRFLVVWSRMDQLIVPQGNARLEHSDLDVRTLELADVGHMSLSMHPRAVHWVASSLARLDDPVERSAVPPSRSPSAGG